MGATTGSAVALAFAVEASQQIVDSGVRSEDYDAKLAMKMREIEVLQRKTEENISRLSGSRRAAANLSPATPSPSDKWFPDPPETTLDGLRKELSVVSGQFAANLSPPNIAKKVWASAPEPTPEYADSSLLETSGFSDDVSMLL